MSTVCRGLISINPGRGRRWLTFMAVPASRGMGDKDRALVWLERAYTQHSSLMATLKVEPAFDPLRSDPRFQDLMRRVGFEP